MPPKKRPIRDLTSWLSDLTFFATIDKNELWMAQYLFYAKKNSKQLLDTIKKINYRKLEKGEINEAEYRQIIDPITPSGSGGQAEYTAADFKTCPIDYHIDNILTAKMDKISETNQLQVNEIDKFAKSQKQRDKDKIIYQREFTKLINEFAKELGLPPVKDTQTPYAYVQELGKGASEKMIDSVDSLLDFIRSQIRDNQDLVMYEQYIYKGDIERAFELGIQHYLVNMNKWRIKGERFYNDIKNFNLACGTWDIDEISGRGTVNYVEPDTMYTSIFEEKNGEDIIHFHYEKKITFAEYFRQFGYKQSEDELKEVFELNKQNQNHNLSWPGAKGAKGSNVLIDVGYLSCLTQDGDNFSEQMTNGVSTWIPKPLSWMPNKHTPDKYQSDQQVKVYNVWYSCVYIPPPKGKLANNSAIDWAWQAKYIFNLKKDVDMYRYGPDMRYAKSKLVIWREKDKMSYTDTKEAFMGKIRTTWHKFQNCLVQDTTAMVMSKDLLAGLLRSVDEGNTVEIKSPEGSGNNGKDAGIEAWKQLKQSGQAFFNFRDSATGDIVVDPSKLFVYIDTRHLEKGEKLLNSMFQQYNLMAMSLAQNDISQGKDPKPRTSVEGIKESMDAVSMGTWFIEKGVREFYIMFGERVVQHILCMIKERKKYGFKRRWEEFENVIGKAHVLMMEGIEDLEPEEIGLTVDLEDTNAMKKYVMEMANKMADDGEVGREVVGLVMNQARQNWKYAYVLLMIAAKQKDREKAKQQQLVHEQEMQKKQMDLKIQMQIVAGKGEAKDKNIMTEGKVQAMLEKGLQDMKHEHQKEIKEILKNNKIAQDENKERLSRETTAQQPMGATT